MFPGVCIAIPQWRDNGKQFSMHRSSLMEPRSLQYMADACEGLLLAGLPASLASRVSTDSRAVRPGDLFVALKGERFDGHAFAAQAAADGAVGLVLDRAQLPSPLPKCGVVAVKDTRKAFGQMAARYRHDFPIPLIAVAGSNGKTTTKDILATVLAQKFNTLRSEASFNNDVGVPATLLNLTDDHQVAVLEFGTNHPGELASLLKLARPRFGVITGIGREHLEFFGGLPGVLEEEGSLAQLLPPDGRLFINGDSWGAEDLMRRASAPAVCVGLGTQNDWQATGVRMDERGIAFGVRSRTASFGREFRLPLLGRHQVANALLAIAVAAEFGMSPEEVQRGLLSCVPAKMRLEFCVAGGVRILDDSYNANADSMRAALETLRDFPCHGRRMALLGDMAELGDHARAAHVEIGQFALECKVEHLFTLGEMASVTAEAARRAGVKFVQEFADVASAAEGLRKVVRPDDIVLLKASRVAGLERIRRLLEQETRGD